MMECRWNSEERDSARVLLELALREDHASEDISSALTLPEDASAVVTIGNRSSGVICGTEVPELAFELLGASLSAEILAPDGTRCEAGRELVRLEGRWRDVVSAERSILNLMGMLSGTSTLTRAFVEAAGPSCQVLDTRKTYPGARLLQKYAVRCGGGTNHRMHLADGFLLKDNHRNASISWADLVIRARALGESIPVVIEVDCLEQFAQALELKPDRILLDNFDLDMIRQAREQRDGSNSEVALEVSGGVELERVPAIAKAGADYVSVGALTHSAPTWDIGMDLRSVEGGLD
jgi:nicotinate-nucleotide pyrophosphorylase (carboxylating)